MKIKGKTLDKPKNEIVVIPRGDDNIVFKCQYVDIGAFDSIVPRPKPTMVQKRGKAPVEDTSHPEYRKNLATYNEKYMDYLVLQSLKATEDLEWETVDMKDPETWKNYKKELEDAGFSILHLSKILEAVMAVNGLNEDRIKEARDSFLAMQQSQNDKQNSQEDEQVSS